MRSEAGSWNMNGLAPSLAEIEALKGLTGMMTCDIVVCPPFTPDSRCRAHLPSIEGCEESHETL